MADVARRLDDPRIEALGMLIETHAEVTNEVDRRLGTRHALASQWLGVLIRLSRTPGEALRMTALANEMTISTSGLTRLVDRIEAAGLVERRACPDDKRGLLVHLTDAGRRRLAEVVDDHLADVDAVLAASLSPAELRTLTDLLRRVRDGVRAGREAPGA